MDSAFSHHMVIIIAALLIIIYSPIARKVKFFPEIPFKLVLVYLALQFAFISLPPYFAPQIHKILDVAATTALYCAISRILFYFVVELWFIWRHKTKTPKITRDITLAIAYSVAFIIILRTRGGVDPLGLITTSAVLTAMIGLAAQNVLGNLFASITIQIERPYRIGDWIQFHEHVGRVINVGWEATRILNMEDELIIIPNLDISKSTIKNYSMPTTRHVMKIDVGVEYGAPPDQVKKILIDICSQEPNILKEPVPVIRITNYGDFAVNYQIRCFYDDFSISQDLRAAVMRRVWYALKRNNIRIPFPVRDVHFKHIERKIEQEEFTQVRVAARRELAQVPILKPLPEQSLDIIAEHMLLEEYGDGENIVRQGDAGDSLFILHKGVCDVELSDGKHPPTKIATMTAPAFFGEMSLLTGEPRTATVKSVGSVVVFSIDKALFKDVFVSHPAISEELARVLESRQRENATTIGQQEVSADDGASKILSRIKSFFGIT